MKNIITLKPHQRSPILDFFLPLIIGFSIGALLLRSPIFPFFIVCGLLLLPILIRRPEIGLLGILIATASIVFEERLPVLSAGSISLHIPDLLLLGLLGLIPGRWLFVREFRIVRTPLDLPLLIFYGVTLLSTFIGILQSSVEIKEALKATRLLSYYLTFFVVTNLVRETRQLTFLLNGLFLLATFVAAAMGVQFFLGDSLQLLPGYASDLITQGTVFEGITRIIPPGVSIVLVSFVTILCTLTLEKLRPLGLLKFLQCSLLGCALLVTFLRSYWAVLIMIIILLVYLVRGTERRRLIGLAMVVIFLASMILLVVFSSTNSRVSRLVGASMDRFNTLGGSGTYKGEDDSVDWRMVENEYAFSKIPSHPLMGLGMSAIYRPWDPRLDHFTADGSEVDFRNFIHNGHLLILLQSGLFGYISLMWLSLAFLIRGLRYWRKVVDDRMRGVVLGFTLAYLAILIAAWVNSTFMQWYWIPVIGIIMGINELILRKVDRETTAA
jgi:O-antigen ligase